MKQRNRHFQCRFQIIKEKPMPILPLTIADLKPLLALDAADTTFDADLTLLLTTQQASACLRRSTPGRPGRTLTAMKRSACCVRPCRCMPMDRTPIRRRSTICFTATGGCGQSARRRVSVWSARRCWCWRCVIRDGEIGRRKGGGIMVRTLDTSAHAQSAHEALLPPTQAYPWHSAPVDPERLRQYLSVCMARGIG